MIQYAAQVKFEKKGIPMVRTLHVIAFSVVFAVFTAPASAQAAEKTKVVFFFDTEDFIQPRSSDAIRDIANILASEGIKAISRWSATLERNLWIGGGSMSLMR